MAKVASNLYLILLPLLLGGALGLYVFESQDGMAGYNIPYYKDKSVNRQVGEDFHYTTPVSVGLSDGVGGYNFPSTHMAKFIVLNATGVIARTEVGVSVDTKFVANNFSSNLFLYLEAYDNKINTVTKNVMKKALKPSKRLEAGFGAEGSMSSRDFFISSSNFQSFSAKGRSEQASVFRSAGTLLNCHIVQPKTGTPLLGVLKTGDSLLMHFTKYKAKDGLSFYFLPAYITSDMQLAFNAPAQITSFELDDLKTSLKDNHYSVSDSNLLRHLLNVHLSTELEHFEVPVSPEDILLLATDGLYDNLPPALIAVLVNYILYEMERHQEDVQAGLKGLNGLDVETILQPLIDDLYADPVNIGYYGNPKNTEGLYEMIDDLISGQEERKAAERTELRRLEMISTLEDLTRKEAALYLTLQNKFAKSPQNKIRGFTRDQVLGYLTNRRAKKSRIPIERFVEEMKTAVLNSDKVGGSNDSGRVIKEQESMDPSVRQQKREDILNSRSSRFTTILDKKQREARIRELKDILATGAGIEIDSPLKAGSTVASDAYRHYASFIKEVDADLQKTDYKLDMEEYIGLKVPVMKKEAIDSRERNRELLNEGFQRSSSETSGTVERDIEVSKIQPDFNETQSDIRIRSVAPDLKREKDPNNQLAVDIGHSYPTISQRLDQTTGMLQAATDSGSNTSTITKGRFTIKQSQDPTAKPIGSEEEHLGFQDTVHEPVYKSDNIYSAPTTDGTGVRSSHDANLGPSVNPSPLFRSRLLEEKFQESHCSLIEFLDSSRESDVPGIDKIQLSPCILKLISKYAVKKNYLPEYGMQFMSKTLAVAVKYIIERKHIAFTSFGVKALIFGYTFTEPKPDDISVITTMVKNEEVTTKEVKRALKKETLDKLQIEQKEVYAIFSADVEAYFNNMSFN